MPSKTAAQIKKKKAIEKRRRKEAAERNRQALEAKKEKNATVKERLAKGKAAAPKVAEIDLSKASMVFQKKGSIFIGAKSNALDPDHLKELGITRVLNCALEIDVPDFYKKKRIKCEHLLCKDKAAFPIEEWFDQGVEFIRKSVEEEGLNTLVHCQEGRSRSTSMVVCYLIRYQNMTVDSALASIGARRPMVQPNEGFLKKLRVYESEWHKDAADQEEEEEVEGIADKEEAEGIADKEEAEGEFEFEK